MRFNLWLIVLASFMALTGCTAKEAPALVVSLEVDGARKVYQYTEPITVDQFLREVDVELSPLDRVNPELWTQIFDGIQITVRRVIEQEECENVEIPYQERTVFFEGLAQNQTTIGQRGQNGTEQVCYRVRIEDGQQVDRSETSRVVVVPAQDAIIYVSPTGELEPVPVVGTLAYISNGNAWIIRGNSTTKRPLTVSGDLDSRVFSLSSDGKRLLFAREADDDSASFNQLWIMRDTTSDSGDPVRLNPQDVLYAEWVPGEENTVSYSTFEVRDATPGWQALNDLWIIRIDPQTGDQINIDQALERSSGGLYGWWGTGYKWSPDGNKLAWIRADSAGLVDLDNGKLGETLLEYPVFNTLQDWSWRTTVSWSPDSSLIISTVHGPPAGNEPAETSPVFDIGVVASDGSFSSEMVNRVGIWSSPRFSPELISDGSQFPQGYLAYLKARQWQESRSGEYDLVIADRDGSNARIIFPPDRSQPGLTARQFAQDYVWSPDGRQIAFIYSGNLWIIDVETGVAHQLTQDGGASKPVWTR
jgi:Tol biopolymer transport system component